MADETVRNFLGLLSALPDDLKTIQDTQVADLVNQIKRILKMDSTEAFFRMNNGLFSTKPIKEILGVFEAIHLRLESSQLSRARKNALCSDLGECRTVAWLGYEAYLTLVRQSEVFGTHKVVPGTRTLDILTKNAELKDHQLLIRSFLYTCFLNGYRKRETGLFKPHYNAQGEYTHSYELHCEIKDFVYQQCGSRDAVFSIITDKNNMVNRIILFLQDCKEAALPEYITKRDIFSFQNGVFDADSNTFYPYASIDSTPPWAPYAAAKYHDLFFDEKHYASLRNPMDIPTPNIDTILLYQGFSPAVCRVIFAMLGRMIYDVGQKDSLQVVPFFKGVAGSGKSTLILLVRKFYMQTDCGSLESEHASRTFPIEHLHNKLVYTCIDVSPNHSLACTTFFTMTSGEPMAINRKFKTPVQGMWKVPGAFAGNSYPPWVDVGGNVSRRFLTVLFNRAVESQDTGLTAKCEQELAPFMKKCVSLYHQLLSTMHDTKRSGIYTRGVLPEYFHRTRQDMLEKMNPMCGFITSDNCELGEGYGTPFVEFKAAYSSYCKENRISSTRVTHDALSNVGHIYNIAYDTTPTNKITLIRGLRLAVDSN